MAISLAGTAILFSPVLAPRVDRVAGDTMRKWIPSLWPAKPKAPPPKETPPPPPIEKQFAPENRTTTTKLFNGMSLQTNIRTQQGGGATEERARPESYTVEAKLHLQVPSPTTSAEPLLAAAPQLDAVLPSLREMLVTARVANFFHTLYEKKVRFIEMQASRFNLLPTRHNVFDCETILELTHPATMRKALLLQTEMDVLTDGSDPDRTLDYDSSSKFFQPFTSYNWAKRTRTPSPFIPPREQEIAKLEQKLTLPTTSAKSAQELRARIATLRREIEALTYRSHLVASLDPFIVVPGFMVRQREEPFAPMIGDYALVIHQGRAYPAIVGDTGPETKLGEASLLLCKTINPQSSSNGRAVSDLSVVYLIFPGSHDPVMTPPDLLKWQQACMRYLSEMGGDTTRIHAWVTPPAPSTPSQDSGTLPSPATPAEASPPASPFSMTPIPLPPSALPPPKPLPDPTTPPAP
jgi:hypothetical protein